MCPFTYTIHSESKCFISVRLRVYQKIIVARNELPIRKHPNPIGTVHRRETSKEKAGLPDPQARRKDRGVRGMPPGINAQEREKRPHGALSGASGYRPARQRPPGTAMPCMGRTAYPPTDCTAVLSAMGSLTSEFGMGSGDPPLHGSAHAGHWPCAVPTARARPQGCMASKRVSHRDSQVSLIGR